MDTPFNREYLRLRFFRETMDDVVKGWTVTSNRYDIVDKYARLMESALLKKYKMPQLIFYKERFLGERGLAVSPGTKEQLQTLKEFAAFHFKSDAVVREYAQRNGVSSEKVLQWMLEKGNKRFARTEGLTRTPIQHEGSIAASDPGRPWDIHGRGQRKLQGIMQRHPGIHADVDLLQAIANGEYRVMGQKLMRFQVTRTSVARSSGGGDEGGDWTRLEGPADASPYSGGEFNTGAGEPELPTKPEKPFTFKGARPQKAANPPPESLSIWKWMNGNLPSDIAESSLGRAGEEFFSAFQQVERHIPENLRPIVKKILKNPVDAKALQRALGRLRRERAFSGEIVQSYKIAIAYRRAFEISRYYEAAADQERSSNGLRRSICLRSNP